MMWPDRRLLNLFGIELPIVQAPMANAAAVDMAVAVAEAGGLGSFPCAALKPDQIRVGVAEIRSRTNRPINLNFFCHAAPESDAARERAWLKRLAPYYAALGAEPPALPLRAGLTPFGDETCRVVEEPKPQIVSFHFGLPAAPLLARVKAAGCTILSSATTVDETSWLHDHGADVIIAQGIEAGGHRGSFLELDVGKKPGTFALVPQIVDAVPLPVIAAGGIADGRGLAAAFALGASAAQMGTAYLRCPEATISEPHRAALRRPDLPAVITNVVTGRPARALLTRFMREQGPIDTEAPAFPLPTQAVTPLRAKAEAQGLEDFSPLWSGQAHSLGKDMGAEELTRTIAEEALARLRQLAARDMPASNGRADR